MEALASTPPLSDGGQLCHGTGSHVTDGGALLWLFTSVMLPVTQVASQAQLRQTKLLHDYFFPWKCREMLWVQLPSGQQVGTVGGRAWLVGYWRFLSYQTQNSFAQSTPSPLTLSLIHTSAELKGRDLVPSPRHPRQPVMRGWFHCSTLAFYTT